MTGTLAIIAKAPLAGRSKTRLCPPLTPGQAAALADAALRDTLGAVLATPAARRVLVLDGDPGPWLPPGVEVIPQRGDGLAERLASAFEDLGDRTLLIGMDTPQVTPAELSDGLAALAAGASAVLGLAADGGYWAIGLGTPDPAVFRGVPMSVAHTGSVQLRRLMTTYGGAPLMLPRLQDVDFIEDALAVAERAPRTRFAAAVRALDATGRLAA